MQNAWSKMKFAVQKMTVDLLSAVAVVATAKISGLYNHMINMFGGRYTQ